MKADAPVKVIPQRVAPLAIVVIVVVLQFSDVGDWFEYDRSLIAVQPWRLLTGHLVHLSWSHALVNLVALMLITRIFARWLGPRQEIAVLALCALGISLVFWLLLPELAWYRGLSGALHGLFFAGTVVWFASIRGRARWLAAAVFLGGAAKVVFEQTWGGPLPYAAWLGGAVVPQAHLAGMLFGWTSGLRLAAGRRRRQPEP